MCERVYDSAHHLLGYIEQRSSSEKIVLDSHRKILGYVSDKGTFDAHRRRVSWQQVPGLLLANQP